MKTYKFVAVALGSLLLSACTMDQPTWTTAERVEVHQNTFTEKFDTASLDKNGLHGIANHYYRQGAGPMNVAISYDPKDKLNTRSKANAEMVRMEAELRAQGVRDVRITTVPVEGSGSVSSTLVNFKELASQAPAGCGLMPGLDGPTRLPNSAQGEAPDYRQGCTIETIMAQQVARPGDLLGKDGFETNADGRRQERVLNRGYYGTTSNPPLEGMNASDAAKN